MVLPVGAARSSVARIDWGALIARPPPWWKGGRAFMSAPFLCGASTVLEMPSPTEATRAFFPTRGREPASAQIPTFLGFGFP